jgi:hypothetical protein
MLNFPSLALCKEIQINIPIGNKRSKTHLVLTSEGEDTWHTFNKCSDALLAEAQQTITGHLAYGNGFSWKSQPSAYFSLVVGCLPAKDRCTQDFYCLI